MSDGVESGSVILPPIPPRRISETIVISLIVAGLGLAGQVLTAWTAASGKDRELDVKLIEIGVAILRADPKDENSAKIRRWAIEVVEKNSRIPFTPEERAELLDRAIKTSGFSGDYFGSYGGFSGDCSGFRSRDAGVDGRDQPAAKPSN